MNYELKLYDQTLIRFSANDGAYPDVQILWADESHADLFPPDLTKPSAEGIESWVRRRLIPKKPCLRGYTYQLTRFKPEQALPHIESFQRLISQ